MKHNRPVNLDISSIKLPITALVSILHRVSGVVLVAVIPVLLYALYVSLQSPMHFELVAAVFALMAVKIILWLSLIALGYHCSPAFGI